MRVKFGAQQKHADQLQKRALELSIKKGWDRLGRDAEETARKQEQVTGLIANMVSLIALDDPPRIFGIPLRQNFLFAIQVRLLLSLELELQL